MYKFFSLITDLKLELTNPIFCSIRRKRMNHSSSPACTARYVCNRHIAPYAHARSRSEANSVKTIRYIFAPVFEASKRDVAQIFGDEAEPSAALFNIGSPLDMQTPVCLDLDRLTEAEYGIFGKTGTGKTFLTRLILAGLIKQEKAVNLIFDMHSEYGLQARKEGAGTSFV